VYIDAIKGPVEIYFIILKNTTVRSSLW